MRQSLLLIATILLTVSIVLIPGLSALAGDDGAVSTEFLNSLDEKVSDWADLNLLVNAITNNDIKALSLNRSVLRDHDDLFNIEVEGTDIINQRSTGRCWMFAGANVVTPKVMTKLELSDFKLSEAYLAFYDKIEKSNKFLETMIELRTRKHDDRQLQMYLDSPLGDGGWWHYFTGLIEKYGVVPASAMPETKQSSKTGTMNRLINSMLRKSTAEIRRRSDEDDRSLRKYKESVLSDLYRILVLNYGRPPAEFTMRYEEEVDSVTTIVEKRFTPKAFYNEFYGGQMPEYVALVNNPTLEYDKLYLLEGSRNIFEHDDMLVLNLPVAKLKQYTLKSLLDSQIVWFACDVGKDNFNDSGIFAVDIYDYNTTFGLDFKLSKEDRILYKDMSPNHAMALMGADTASDGSVRKWKVENSWGTKKGDSGYWTMYDGWFDEWVLLVIIDQRHLSDDENVKFKQKPIVIEDWQPFFAALRNLQ
ncbi:MAG: C1 family peptidase [candidate division Zixibacteria bacterium]